MECYASSSAGFSAVGRQPALHNRRENIRGVRVRERSDLAQRQGRLRGKLMPHPGLGHVVGGQTAMPT
jgi:hypothetical protein